VTEGRTRLLARAIFALVLLELAIQLLFGVLDWGRGDGSVGDLAYVVSFLLFPIIGVVLATRRPDNAIGWLMLAIGVAAFVPADTYGSYAFHEGLPGAAWALGAVSWTWVPVIGLAGTFVLLLFPDGHLPSPRWRWFAWTLAIGMTVASLGILLSPGTLEDVGVPNVVNPFGIEALRPFAALVFVAIAVVPLGIIGSAAALVVRYRRSGPTERLQIRWLASAAAVLAVVYLVAMVASAASAAGWGVGGSWLSALQAVAISLFALLPISIGIAVLRYRLYDIDVVVRKAVVVTAIAAFFTIVYVAIVGGIGALVQTRATTALSFVAAAIVAALFQPALARARRIADRVVYGRRATPYEVLSEFSDRVGATYAAEDVLPRMARVVAEGVGATSARVWLERGGRLAVAASWPAEGDGPASVPVNGASLPTLPGADAAFAVAHNGQLLGALAVAAPPADPIDEAKTKLVSDLAAQAGLVLWNVRLTEELRRRLEDLKAAQKRLVAAQDEERRKLERNIHDGAQQQLVALSVQIRLAQSLVERDPPRAQAMLGDLQTRTTETLEDLRDLARGIYPPLLADKGLAAALEAQARKSTMAVEVRAGALGRYAPEVEAAVYFCVLEALQNAAKYANAASVRVRLETEDANLRFEVVDDGDGFDPASDGHGSGLQGMADRLAALDGAIEVRSAPGAGTTVLGRIPVGEGR
jgi:signal transduction histidine kinase